MPKITELPEVTSTNSSGYVIGVQDDAAVKYPLSLIGNGGSSIVAPSSGGTSIYTGIEPPTSPTDGQLWIDESQGIQDLNNYINVTSFTTDYPLRRGETAVVNYTSITSVPLHVQTVEGVYELSIQGDVTVSAGSSADCYLLPNNTTVTAGAIKRSETYNTSSLTVSNGTSTYLGYEDGANATKFTLGQCNVIHSKITVNTRTKAKSVLSDCIATATGSNFSRNIEHDFWNDSTTIWSSLGTITFPFAQSGIILIKRLY